MVSIWPWKSKTDDTASFEKTLTSLSSKIQKTNISRDALYARSRRYKVIWTLYTSLAYLLSALILLLVTGWQNWGPVEYTIVAGSPVVIYLVRTALSSYYDYRISSNQAHLDELQKQREEAIEKFKAATNYNSTHQLLEKYGAVSSKPSSPSTKDPSSTRKQKSTPKQNQQPQQQQARTGLPPPPTANIRRPTDTPPQQQQPPQPQPQAPSPQQPPNPTASPQPTADFAPNAFDGAIPQHAQSTSTASGSEHQWYDRILDLLLGEDETKATNRLALICAHCKLVNGLAPPGVKSLADLGRWRCAACKGWNGEEREVERIVRLAERGVGGAGVDDVGSSEQLDGSGAGVDDDVADGVGFDGDAADGVEGGSSDGADDSGEGDDELVPARSTRSQAAAKTAAAS